MANADVVKEPKARQVSNIYIGKDGSESSRPQPDVVAVRKIFLESGDQLDLDLRELPESLIWQAAAFGIIQAGQNAHGSAGSEAERIEMCDDRWDTFKAGNWSAERQTGPRDGDVIAAYALVYKDQKGVDAPEEWIAKVRASIADENNPLTLKSLANLPQVRAHIEDIKAQRQLARQAKAKEALKTAAPLDLDLD